MIDIKTYVICLDKKKEERCDINFPQLQPYFSDINWFNAIDTDTININDYIHPMVKVTMENKISDSYFFIQGKGTVGCALSHLECMKRCIEDDEPIIIIEDDVTITNKQSVIIEESLSKIPGDADFVSLLNIPFTKYSFTNCKTREYNSMWNKIYGPNFHGLQMYYITPRGCEIVLRDAYPIYTHIDQFIGTKLNQVYDFNGYMLRRSLYSTVTFLYDSTKTTIGHNHSYKKFLPDNNTFIVGIIISFIIFIIYHMLNKCGHYVKQKFKF